MIWIHLMPDHSACCGKKRLIFFYYLDLHIDLHRSLANIDPRSVKLYLDFFTLNISFLKIRLFLE